MVLSYEELLAQMDELDARIRVMEENIELLNNAAGRVLPEADPDSDDDSADQYLYQTDDDETEEEVDAVEVLDGMAQANVYFNEHVFIIEDDPEVVANPTRLFAHDDSTPLLERYPSRNRAVVHDDGQCSDTETVVDDYNDPVDAMAYADAILYELGL